MTGVETVTPDGTVGRYQAALVPLLVPLADLDEDAENARQHGPENLSAIQESLNTFGQAKPAVFRVDERGRKVVRAGNGTLAAARALGWTHLAAVEFRGDDRHAKAFAIADNRTAELATWNPEVLKIQMEAIATEFQAEGVEWKTETVGWGEDALEKTTRKRGPKMEDDGLTNRERDATRVEEAPAPVIEVDHGIKDGDLFALGDHRVMCGDATYCDLIDDLMNDEEADLLHADPPYGMSKEAEGVANDNLHAKKLDEFQEAWWTAARLSLKDNASAYIWGNPLDLWRWWFTRPALSEQVFFRNEIVWDKGPSPGQLSDEMRSYAISTERALFFTLTREDFGNQNAEDYWEGWEPLRQALNDELEQGEIYLGEVAQICGVSKRAAEHWFLKSQWTFIPEERYQMLQAACKGDAFQAPYAAIREVYEGLKARHDREVKQPFRESRTFFDNVHDNMAEVWCFPRVTGEDRWGHATPKPVALIERAIRSSCPPGGLVLEPFLGSGTTLIAAEISGRKCYGVELLPQHVASTIKRWETITAKRAIRL